MDDDRIWSFETSLWTGDAANYQEKIDAECVMVLPTPPYVFHGQEAVDAVAATPRWSAVEIGERQVSRPQEGLIVIAYKADATRGGESYVAHCTTTLRRIAHEEWQVVQHQQTPPLAAGAKA